VGKFKSAVLVRRNLGSSPFFYWSSSPNLNPFTSSYVHAMQTNLNDVGACSPL
jgi:hypothetical protein